MNLYQLCQSVPELQHSTFDATPQPAPATAYAVISELTEADQQRLFDQGGVPHAIKEMDVLVSLWGAEGSTKADLRPIWQAVKRLQGLITSHPGIPYIRGTAQPLAIPPTIDRQARRPLAAVTFRLRFAE